MALGMGLVSLVDSLILGSAAIGFMIYINLKLTAAALLPMPLVAFLTHRLSRVLHQRFEAGAGPFFRIDGKSSGKPGGHYGGQGLYPPGTGRGRLSELSRKVP